MTSKALFLDRDGVINKRREGYVNQASDFEFCEGIFDVVRPYRESGHHIIVVTNQAGIHHGHLTWMDLTVIHDKMQKGFEAAGIVLAGVYFCPDYSPTHRKPAPGMILDAARELDIDLAASTLIGDSPTDIEAGKAAGVGTNILIESDRIAALLSPLPGHTQ
jgi:D-glycero-D-manno-heptose 1,7-bisphosphate phosphatase